MANKTLTFGTDAQGIDLIINNGYLQTKQLHAPLTNEETPTAYGAGSKDQVLMSNNYGGVFWGNLPIKTVNNVPPDDAGNIEVRQRYVHVVYSVDGTTISGTFPNYTYEELEAYDWEQIPALFENEAIFIGICTTDTTETPMDFSAYTWSQIRGDKGDAATIEVGTVTAGKNLSVTNSGTHSNAVLDFVIPASGLGNPTATVDNNTGVPSVTVSSSGPDTEKVFNFDFKNLKGAPGEKGNDGAAAGFGTPSATIDGNVGTPSVTVTASGENTAKVFNFDFKNLKAEPGRNGNDGTSAGFGTPTATVDSNVGTPSVTVTSSGDNTAKVFNFDFKNLKGEPGRNGNDGTSAGFGTPTATVDNNTGTPSVTITASGPDTAKVFNFDFKNLKGEKGDGVAIGTSSANKNVYIAGYDTDDTALKYNTSIYYNPSTGELTATKIYNAVWNDYAEWFERENESEVIEPGDVCVWTGNGVSKSSKSNDKAMVGVCSDSYGHILGGEALENMEDNNRKFVPIGLKGRVNVNVIGEVEIGDLLVTSDIPGCAEVNNDAPQNCIIGKALQGSNDINKKKITVLI